MLKKLNIFYGWYIVFACWGIVFLSGSVAVSIFFKPMLEDFGWNRTLLSSVQSVALILFTVIAPLLGRLIDRFGPKVMLLGCVVTQVFSRLINGAATDLWHLYLARFLFGVNSLPSSQVLINRWFIKRRGMALGFFATGMPLGTLILTPISQHLILVWGWRTTMFFWAAVSFIVMLPLTLFIRNNPTEVGNALDGNATYHPIKPILSKIPEQPLSKIEKPAHKHFLLKNRSFCFLSLAHIICGTGCGFMMTHIVVFATDFGYSEMIGASLVSVQGGLNLIGILITGPLSDRIARKNVLSLTHGIRSASFFTIVFFIITGGHSIHLLFFAMGLFGFGWFTTAPLTGGLVADLFGHFRIGTIIGITMSCHMFGMALGAYSGGAVYEMTHSYLLVFLIQGILEFFAAIFAFSISSN